VLRREAGNSLIQTGRGNVCRGRSFFAVDYGEKLRMNHLNDILISLPIPPLNTALGAAIGFALLMVPDAAFCTAWRGKYRQID